MACIMAKLLYKRRRTTQRQTFRKLNSSGSIIFIALRFLMEGNFLSENRQQINQSSSVAISFQEA